MKVFETPTYIMNIYDDLFVEFLVKRDVQLSDEDVWQSKKEAEAYMPGKKYYVLMGGEEFFQVSKEARETAASEKFSTHIAAVALFSNELALKILGNLYIKINRPIVPTRFFNDKQKAKDWLITQKTTS